MDSVATEAQVLAARRARGEHEHVALPGSDDRTLRCVCGEPFEDFWMHQAQKVAEAVVAATPRPPKTGEFVAWSPDYRDHPDHPIDASEEPCPGDPRMCTRSQCCGGDS